MKHLCSGYWLASDTEWNIGKSASDTEWDIGKSASDTEWDIGKWASDTEWDIRAFESKILLIVRAIKWFAAIAGVGEKGSVIGQRPKAKVVVNRQHSPDSIVIIYICMLARCRNGMIAGTTRTHKRLQLCVIIACGHCLCMCVCACGVCVVWVCVLVGTSEATV